MSGSSKGGRPVGTRLVSTGLSKTQVKCVVCSLERRGDKIKDHQVHSVLFDSEGNPADSSHPRYESLSESKKEHTDYFRINGYNFSKEIKLCYNLPPLHVLSKSFIPEIVKTLTSHKEFFRKGDKKSQSILSRLKSTSLSATLYNFREEEEKKSKLPVDLFK